MEIAVSSTGRPAGLGARALRRILQELGPRAAAVGPCSATSYSSEVRLQFAGLVRRRLMGS
jgi:hypothetical protein